MSRVNAGTPPEMMLIVVRVAPTLISANVPFGGQPVVDLEDVLHGEGVDVDDRGLELRLPGEVRGGLELFALGRHEQDVHLPLVGPTLEHFVVDVHVFDLEGDLLLGLPSDLLAELLRGHERQGQALDDHRVSRDRERDLAALHLEVGEELLERLDDDASVHHLAIDDGLRRKGRVAELDQRFLLLDVLEQAELDRARPDVHADEVVAFRHDSSRPTVSVGARRDDGIDGSERH
jgi:hypothetical protein